MASASAASRVAWNSACLDQSPPLVGSISQKRPRARGCPPDFNTRSTQALPTHTHCCVGAIDKPAPPPPPLGRYRVANLRVTVAAPTESYVFDVGGSGVEITNVTVTMPHTLSGSGSVFHTTGSAFRVTHCTCPRMTMLRVLPGYHETACCSSTKAQTLGMSDTIAFKWDAVHLKAILHLGFCWKTTTLQISNGQFSQMAMALRLSARHVCQSGSPSLETCMHCVFVMV